MSSMTTFETSREGIRTRHRITVAIPRVLDKSIATSNFETRSEAASKGWMSIVDSCVDESDLDAFAFDPGGMEFVYISHLEGDGGVHGPSDVWKSGAAVDWNPSLIECRVGLESS